MTTLGTKHHNSPVRVILWFPTVCFHFPHLSLHLLFLFFSFFFLQFFFFQIQGKVQGIILNRGQSVHELLELTHPELKDLKYTLSRVAIGSDLYFDAEKYLISLEESQCAQNFTVSAFYANQGQRTWDAILQNGTF